MTRQEFKNYLTSNWTQPLTALATVRIAKELGLGFKIREICKMRKEAYELA